MDDLDRKILSLLAKNARMPVKEIAEQVSLTSPAVSSRIHRLEQEGIISGYTVTLNRPADRMYVDALISLSVAPSKQDAFLELLQSSKEVLQCYHVTGAYTFLVKVSCGSMPQLEHLILQFQKLGTIQHPDHPFHAREPRRPGRAHAVSCSQNGYVSGAILCGSDSCSG